MDPPVDMRPDVVRRARHELNGKTLDDDTRLTFSFSGDKILRLEE
jgi:hypothetical protein